MDLAYLQKEISGVFLGGLNFENLYFGGILVTAVVFFRLLNKCCILKCFIFLTVFFLGPALCTRYFSNHGSSLLSYCT